MSDPAENCSRSQIIPVPLSGMDKALAMLGEAVNHSIDSANKLNSKTAKLQRPMPTETKDSEKRTGNSEIVDALIELADRFIANANFIDEIVYRLDM